MKSSVCKTHWKRHEMWEKTHLEKKVQINTDESITSHCTQITYLSLVKVRTKYIFASKNKIELGNFQVNTYIYIRKPFIFTIILKTFCYQKLFWPFTVWINCSSDLKNFANSRRLSASNFKSFSRSLEQFFLTVGQNNFGNKIPFTIYLQLHTRFKF